MKFIFGVILLIIISLLPSIAQIQDTLRYDLKEKVIVRTSSGIEKYLNDPDFQYDKHNIKAPANVLERLLKYIAKFFRLIDKGGKTLGYIIYILMFAVLLFVIYKLLGSKYQSFFLKKKSLKDNTVLFTEEELIGTDIESLIKEAISNGHYRFAVRYLYVKLLQLLSLNELIDIEINKTNAEYGIELKKTSFFKDFKRLTYIFDYVWYGEFDPDKTTFAKYHSEFESLYRILDEKKRP